VGGEQGMRGLRHPAIMPQSACRSNGVADAAIL
jgi:hypothetical protein